MSSLLVHYCHGENWKSPTRSFGRSGKAKRTFPGTKRKIKHLQQYKKAQQTRVKRNAQVVFSGIILTHIKHKNQ